MNYEGVPTAAQNVVHADDLKIAVLPLGLELVHMRPTAVVAWPVSLNLNLVEGAWLLN